MIQFGDRLLAAGASENFVRGLEKELADLPQWFPTDVQAERARRRKLATRARDMAARFDRDIDGRLLTIDELLDRPGDYRIAWAFGQIRTVPRPPISRALIEAAELLEGNPSWLRYNPKPPRDLVLAVADVLIRRLDIVFAHQGRVLKQRPIVTIAAISSIICGRRVTKNQVSHFIKRAISARRNIRNGPIS